MNKWDNPAAWSSLVDGSACPICVRGHLLDIIETLESSWLTMSEDAPMPGYACLVTHVHAVELHDLSETQAETFMRDARLVSKALSVATGAIKLNDEIHGNPLPHLHMHFFPRYPGDAFEGRAIQPRLVQQPIYSPGHFSEVQCRFLKGLRLHNPVQPNSLRESS